MVEISPVSNCMVIPSAVHKLLYDYRGRKDRQIDMEELLSVFLQYFIASVSKTKTKTNVSKHILPLCKPCRC
jgi:hypothetical protein